MKEGTLSKRAELLLIDDHIKWQSRRIEEIEEQLDKAIEDRTRSLKRKKWLLVEVPESIRL